MIETALGIGGVVLLILANALFVAVEFSLVAVDRSEVEAGAASGDRRAALVSALVRRLSFHLSGVQLGITVCSVVLGFLSEPVVAKALRPAIEPIVGSGRVDGVSVVVALALATVVQMVVGELVPKSLAVARPLSTARAVAPFERWYGTLFSPVIRLFGGAADRAVRRLGIEPKEELSTVRSRSELVRLVRSSTEGGTLPAEEATLLARAFRFTEKSVADSLTPRPDVIAVGVDATGADLVAAAVDSGFSRFPVIGTDLDDVVGVVHVKSVLEVDPVERDVVPVRLLMADPYVVPEALPLDSLLIEMRRRATYLAVVADEYGGTSGIITLEDLLEEIVGDIDDEYDELAPVPPRSAGPPTLAGRLHPDEVEEACGFVVPPGDYETLAGFVIDRLGRIPAVGDRVSEAGWALEVVEMDRRRVASVRVTPPPEPMASDDNPTDDDASGGDTAGRGRDGGQR